MKTPKNKLLNRSALTLSFVKDSLGLLFAPDLYKFKNKFKFIKTSIYLAIKYSKHGSPRLVPSSDVNSAIWRSMNHILRFNLRYTSLPGMIKSPVINAVTSPNMFNYKIKVKPSNNLNIEKTAKDYAEIFLTDENKFKNALMYHLNILCTLFERDNFKFINSKNILQIGPGLGLLDYFLYLEGAELYSFETNEMSYFQELIYSQIRKINLESKVYFRDYSLISKPFAVISFFAFTELDMCSRELLLSTLKNADWIVIVSNANFEGISNFDYLNNVFSTDFILKKNFSIGELGIANMPNYAKNHEAFLFVKK
jgi:hypothetical protein